LEQQLLEGVAQVLVALEVVDVEITEHLELVRLERLPKDLMVVTAMTQVRVKAGLLVVAAVQAVQVQLRSALQAAMEALGFLATLQDRL
jgi:hypothetical protein